MKKKLVLFLAITISIVLSGCFYTKDDLLAAVKATITSFTPYPTYTKYPTLTRYPTYTPVPLPTDTPTIEPTPTKKLTSTPANYVGVEIDCGSDLSIKMIDTPQTTRRLGFDTASGIYVIFKFELYNKTGSTISGLDQNSFELRGELDSNRLIYSVDSSSTSGYSFSYGFKTFYYDDIQPGLAYRSVVSFDVNPKLTSVSLIFRPKESYGSTYGCSVNFDYGIIRMNVPLE